MLCQAHRVNYVVTSDTVIGSFPPVRATAHRGFRYPEPEYPALPATLISTITLPNPYRQAGRRGEVDVLKLKSAPGRRRKDHEDGAAAGQPAGNRAEIGRAHV